jgi:uncharacterized protein YeaO (DUF488 family)
MNEKGLPVLLDNIEIRGIDQLKLMVNDWLQELAQQKQQAQAQAAQEQQNNPLVMRNQIEMAKVQQKGQQIQIESQNQQTQFQIDLERLKQDQMKLMTEASIAKDDGLTQRIKAEAERFSKQVDLALRKKDMAHNHFRDAIEVHHKVHSENRKMDMEHRKNLQ